MIFRSQLEIICIVALCVIDLADQAISSNAGQAPLRHCLSLCLKALGKLLNELRRGLPEVVAVDKRKNLPKQRAKGGISIRNRGNNCESI